MEEHKGMELEKKLGKWGYINWRFSQLSEKVNEQHEALKKKQLIYHDQINRQNAELKELLHEIKAEVKPEQELWDNSDLMRNWKISERTLATWRSKRLIGFVQRDGKIWYPRKSRELFLSVNFIKTKGERENEGEED